MGRMKIEDHIDPEIFDGFTKNQVYLDCAQGLFDPEHAHEIDETRIPVYSN